MAMASASSMTASSDTLAPMELSEVPRASPWSPQMIHRSWIGEPPGAFESTIISVRGGS